MVILDSDVIVAILRGERASRDALRSQRGAGVPIAVSAISVHELWFGVTRCDRPLEESERINQFLAGGIEILSFTEHDAQRAGEIRGVLDDAGQRIGAYDLFIAAQVLDRGATLATRNRREFSRVPDLTIADWPAEPS